MQRLEGYAYTNTVEALRLALTPPFYPSLAIFASVKAAGISRR
jgi:hypothetical protein